MNGADILFSLDMRALTEGYRHSLNKFAAPRSRCSLVRFPRSTIQCGQHLADKQFQCGQVREPAAVEHEIVHSQLDEGAHLLH